MDHTSYDSDQATNYSNECLLCKNNLVTPSKKLGVNILRARWKRTGGHQTWETREPTNETMWWWWWCLVEWTRLPLVGGCIRAGGHRVAFENNLSMFGSRSILLLLTFKASITIFDLIWSRETLLRYIERKHNVITKSLVGFERHKWLPAREICQSLSFLDLLNKIEKYH